METNNGEFELNHDLARTDKQEYKRRLIETVKRNPVINPFYQAMVASGLFNESFLDIDPNTWYSDDKIDLNHLRLGVFPMSLSDRTKLIYKGEGFSYQDLVVHRFVHELVHSFFPHLRLQGNPNLKFLSGGLFKNIEEIRKINPSLGLTSLASQPEYVNKKIPNQTLEDIVELITLYVTKPQVFEEYFSEVILPKGKRGLRSRNGIAEVNSDQARTIKTLVVTLVQRGIDFLQQK